MRQRPWYTGAVAADGLYFTGIQRDAYSGRIQVTCSVPVKLNGEIVGVAGIDIVLENMSGFSSTETTEGTFIYVINDRGQVILPP